MIQIKIFLGLFFSGFLFSCVTTSETHRKQLILVPDVQMNQLGEQAYREAIQSAKESNDQTLTARIKNIGQKLAQITGKNFNWEFKIFESEQMNAFCLPGGKIAVYTGILKVAPSDDELAIILGHEIAHAILRHSAERMSQGLLAQGTMGAIDLTLRDNRHRDLILGALGAGVTYGAILPYSRKHESEADHVGTLYAARAGFDPRFAVKVWENMEKHSGKTPEFLSTHPDPRNRARALENKMDQYLSEWRH